MHLRLLLMVASTLPCIAGLSAAEPIKVVMLSGSDEYKSEKHLGEWKAHLEKTGAYSVDLIHSPKVTSLPELVEKLAKAQVFVTYTHRFNLDAATLAPIKAWCKAGKPVIGLRTASHGYQSWLEFDKQVLGGNYARHGSASFAVAVYPANKDHAILQGVSVDWQSRKLYTNLIDTLPAKAHVLLTGSENGKTSAFAWFHEYHIEGGTPGRSFYCSGGVELDWASPQFVRMMDNALEWVRQPVSATASPSATSAAGT